MFERQFVAIDPMALLLSEKAYLIWVELHHPHVEDVAKAVATLTNEEKQATLARANMLIAYGEAVKAAIGKAQK
ncbi:MAG: hypothetical protein ACYDBJ_23505 [Aggregatilineales bacterium]